MAGGRLIWLGMRVAIGEPPAVLVEAGVQIVRGRGLDGLPWALKSLLARSRDAVHHPRLRARSATRSPTSACPPARARTRSSS